MLFVELFRRGFRQQSAYRGANLAGLFTNTVFGFVQGAILVAAIRAGGRGQIGGYDVQGARSFTWLAQALIAPIAIFRWTDIAERVQSGAIATDLTRPADFQRWWLAVDYGRAASALAVRSVPQYAIGTAFFTLARPETLGRAAAFAISLGLAITVSFGLRFVANLVVFWTVEARGVMATHQLLMVGLSGMTVPLTFFPKGLAAVLRALPWAGIVQAPADVFLGRRDALPLIGLQALWAAALLVLGRAQLRRAHRILVVQGG